MEASGWRLDFKPFDLMEFRNKKLLSISRLIGLIAFIGGWIIFLTWAAARYFFAVDFEILEIVGFFWLFAFFWLAILAMILLGLFAWINRTFSHRKILIAALILLINIPSVLFVLPLQGQVGNKVFVKLTNQSGISTIELRLHGNLKTWDLGRVNQGSSKIFHYDPPFWNHDARLYQKPDTLELILIHKERSDTVGFPTLRMGECKWLILDENLELVMEDNSLE